MSRALVFLLVCLSFLAATSSRAATGPPDAAGYTWADNVSGCGLGVPAYGAGAITTLDTNNMLGPYPLGFTMPFYGAPVSQVWVSPHGYVAFQMQATVGTPAAIPNAGNPINYFASYWTTIVNADVTVEAVPGAFQIRWVQLLQGTATNTHHLIINSDGSFRIVWQGNFDTVVSIGHENTTGQGRQLYRDPNSTIFGDEYSDGGNFPPPFSSTSACITPPVLLNCASAIPVACGASIPTSLPAADPGPASVYSCAPSAYNGNEQVFRLDVTSPSQVSVSLSAPALDLFQIDDGDCREGRCIGFSANQMDFPILFPGTYYFVADKLAAGGGDAYTFQTTCIDPFTPAGCGDSFADTTSGASAFDTYSCAPGTFTGPEKLYRVSLATATSLLATLQTAVPNLWVVIYDAASFDAQGPCLRAGRGGTGVFNAPPGDYVIVVDGTAGAAGAYTLHIECGLQLDCTSSQPLSCATIIAGDTSASPRDVAIYNCSSEALTGGEDIYTFYNPVEQTVDVRFLSSTPGQRIMLIPGCDEGACLLGGNQGVACALFPAGQYTLVVDGTSSGPYELYVSCSEVATGVDLRVSAIDASPLAGDCRTFDVAGTTTVLVANLGDQPALAPIEVIVFEDTNLDGDYFPGIDNLLGQTTLATDIQAGETLAVSVPSAGTVAFRDNVIYAKVDAANTVPETSETNNLWDTGRGCEYRPAVGVFTPTVEWSWTSSPILPTYVHVDTIPLVGDVNGDTVPDIIFNAGVQSGGFGDGVVRALDGRGRGEIWTADQTNAHVYASSNLALGDIDGDTLPEIIGQANPTVNTLVAIDSDGTTLWTSQPLINPPPQGNGGGAPAIGDLNCDGLPEIVWGHNAFNQDGGYFWRPPEPPEPIGTIGANGAGQGGSISIIVDINNDGIMEVVAGPTAYRYDSATGRGVIVWTNPNVPDGYAAAGNFDDDPLPEIAITSNGTLYVLEGDTGALKWSRQLPRGGGGCNAGTVTGGPPTVADFDADCLAEIGVAGADFYTVFETDGTVKWSAPINDCSSHRTASTVFDFDGDGAAEVAFADQTWLHIFRGQDGSEIARVASASHTWTEMVSIADVDADNNAEVILPVNASGGPTPSGIYVVGDLDDNWVNTRRIWNQHSYHITNINDDSSIPGPLTNGACEEPSWIAHGTYRDQLGSGIYTAPDITISIVRSDVVLRQVSPGNCVREVEITARVGNGGGINVGTSFTAWFYNGDPTAGGTPLTSLVLSDLEPGEFGDFSVTIPFPGVGSVDIWAIADDDGTGASTINECREDNNTCVVTVTNTGLPIDPPAPLGPALRATDHGDPDAAIITADFNWLLDQGLPREPDEHYHIYRGTNPQSLSIVPGTEPYTSTTYQDATTRATDIQLPLVHYFRIVPADGCEQEALASQ